MSTTNHALLPDHNAEQALEQALSRAWVGDSLHKLVKPSVAANSVRPTMGDSPRFGVEEHAFPCPTRVVPDQSIKAPRGAILPHLSPRLGEKGLLRGEEDASGGAGCKGAGALSAVITDREAHDARERGPAKTRVHATAAVSPSTAPHGVHGDLCGPYSECLHYLISAPKYKSKVRGTNTLSSHQLQVI